MPDRTFIRRPPASSVSTSGNGVWRRRAARILHAEQYRVKDRNEPEREDGGDPEPKGDDDRHAVEQRIDREDQRQEAQNRRHRRHEYGAQSREAGGHDGIVGLASRVQLSIYAVNQDDAVVDDDSGEA